MCVQLRKSVSILFCFLLLLIPSFWVASVYGFSEESESKGKISFQPSIINELSVSFVEEFFRFTWLDNSFDLKLTFGYNDTDRLKELSLKDYWEKTEHQMKWKEVLKRTNVYEFGYNLSDIPQKVSDRTLYLKWTIEEPTFTIEEISLDEIETMNDYNITKISLPDNLVLSYEDLYNYGFTVQHLDKLEVKIGNVKGKTELNLDPITYSSPVITVIGGTVGAPLDTMDIWNADQGGAWNVVINNNSTDTQFEFNAKLVFGNGTVAGTTYFNETNVQWVFNNDILSAHNQFWMELKRYSHVAFGVLENATEKTTSQGVSFISLEDYYQTYLNYQYPYDTTVYFYSCSITCMCDLSLSLLGTNLRLYNSILIRKTWISDVASSDIYNSVISQVVSAIAYPRGTIDRLSIIACSNALYIRYAGTVNNLYVRDCTYLWYDSAFNAVDLYLVNCDSDVWSGIWGTGTGELWRQYTFDLTVTFPNGSIIESANVTVRHFGQGEAQDFTELTNPLGAIDQQVLTMGFYNLTGGNTIYSYNMHEITVVYEGMQTYQKNFTLSDETAWIIALQAEQYNWMPLLIVLGLGCALCFVFAMVKS